MGKLYKLGIGRRPPVMRSPLSKSLVFKLSSRIRLMKKQKRKLPPPPPPVVEEEAPSGLRRHRPLRRCRDEMPREFKEDYYYYCRDLPEELWREILLRLPSVESLIKCTTVCKSWRCVIKNPTFVDAQLARGLNRNQNRNEDGGDGGPFLLQRGIFNVSYSVYWDKPKSEFEFGGEFFPLNNINSSKSIECPGDYACVHHGTCNGLICFADDDNCEIPTVICNPLLRKFVTLPRPSIPIPDLDGSDPYDYVSRTSWFGYDPHTNDYKVLRILGSPRSGPAGDIPFGVELYSLARGSWKTLSRATFPGCFEMFGLGLGLFGLGLGSTQTFWPSHVHCNGALHWLLARDRSYQERVLVSFDLVSESFCEILLPQAFRSSINNGSSVFLSIHEQESLALIEVDQQRSHCDLHLWVMQQYGAADSWTVSTVTLGDRSQYSYSASAYPWPFGFKSNGEQFFKLGFTRGRDRVLLKVDFKTKHVNGLLDLGSKYMSIDPFVESLVLLNQSNALSY